MTYQKNHESFQMYLNFFLLILYCLFVFLDLFTKFDTSIIKYSFVWVCIIYILITKEDSLHPNDWKSVLVGFFLTAIADFLLLFTNYFVIGIYTFCLVQLWYIHRLNSQRNFDRYFMILTVFTVIFGIGHLVSDLLFAAILYAVLLLTHLLSTFWTQAPVKKHFLQIGMICFVICDINVALYNRLPSNDPLYNFASLAMWSFYAPALYCISHSVLRKKKKPSKVNDFLSF